MSAVLNFEIELHRITSTSMNAWATAFSTMGGEALRQERYFSRL